MTLRHSYFIRCCVIIALFFCASQKASGEDFIDLNIKFSPSARVSTYGYQIGNYKGVPYKFYGDGSGDFGSLRSSSSYHWDTSCGQDAMTDYRYCFASKGNLSVWVFDDGRMGFNIGIDHYPGTGVQLRIGSSSPYKADKNGWWGEEARRVLQRLLKAQKAGKLDRNGLRTANVTTRYQEWPYKSNKDETINLFGLSVVFEYLNWAANGQKPRELESTISTGNSKKSTSKPEKTDLVRVIQFTLNLKGYNVGEPDGLMGPRTLNAIKTYQTRNELPPDGKPSIELLKHVLQ